MYIYYFTLFKLLYVYGMFWSTQIGHFSKHIFKFHWRHIADGRMQPTADVISNV